MGFFTAWVEKHIILAKGEEWSLTFLERILVAGRALLFYTSKLVLPLKLTFIYPRWHISPMIWWQYLYPLLALLVIVILWLFRNRLGKGTLVSVLFFAGTLFPALGFFNIYPMRYSFVADHFQYLASIGLIVLGASVLYQIGEIIKKRIKSAPTIFFILFVSLLGFQTWRQTHIYKDLETLWTDTIKKNPTGWMAYTNLSLLRESQGRMEEALKLAQKVLELRPNDPIAKHNLANILLGHGQIGEAIQILRDVVVQKPDLAPAHSLLGSALFQLGNYDEAEKHLRIAIKLDPNYINPHESLARLFFARKQFEECIKECYEVLIRDPNNALVWLMAGDALDILGRKKNAIEAYQKALEAQPNLLEAKERLKKLQGN